ncbi:alpha/beta hydrolase [Microbacterium sp.]|uniref:alpha/beta fold hydrolase n=1 Tax=Microbacterium sp. TaxID=51671 RepID=UPI0039E5F2E7
MSDCQTTRHQIDLLAHSAGTGLALAVATRYPHRVRSMALVTPPVAWLTGTHHDGDSLVLDRTVPAVTEALRSLERDDPTTENAFREIFRRQAPATYAHWTHVEEAHATLGEVSLAPALAWFNDIPADATARIRAADSPRRSSSVAAATVSPASSHSWTMPRPSAHAYR